MTEDRFIAIFLEVLGDTDHDREWAEICWSKVPIAERTTLEEGAVREAAVDWKKYGDEGGF